MGRSPNTEKSGASKSSSDIAALARALAPIAKLCMKSGMGAGELQMAAKIACIGVAAESAILGNRLNHSRIAAATGLTRKDVRALAGLLNAGTVRVAREVAKQRTARVLHGWRTDPQYMDRHGNPLRLRIAGTGATFRDLVSRYAGDVTPISVLKELVKSSAVSRMPDGSVILRKNTPRVRGFGADAVAEFSGRMRDLGSSLVKNIEGDQNPVFIGFSDITNLSADEAALFQDTFSERAASLVDGVERWRTGQARIRARLKVKRSEGTRVGLGVYLVEQRPPEPPAASAKKPVIRAKSKRVKR